MPTLPGHQRNVSQGQHLIVDPNDSGDEDDAERGRAGVFPGGSPIHLNPSTQYRPQANKPKGLCSDPHIRSNIKVILGSIVLTIVGTILLVLGTIVMFRPDEGPQGWVFLFAGFLCFVPGSYHVYYIICTLCGRPGYSFDRLPTFNR
ncbi:hypothetical protein RB195_007846 [Necator americanus]|uniref:Transmembrane protein 134 n=1 Tax=Necator americanus TaxID=51031 RepID=A0ABR1C1U3_NECAM